MAGWASTSRPVFRLLFELYATTACNTSKSLPRERWVRLCRELLCVLQGTLAKPVLSIRMLGDLYDGHGAVRDAGSLEQLVTRAAASWWSIVITEPPSTLRPARLRWREQMTQHAAVDAMLDSCASAFLIGVNANRSDLFDPARSSLSDGRLHRAMARLLIPLRDGEAARLHRFTTAAVAEERGRDPTPCTPVRRQSVGCTGVGISDDATGGSAPAAESAGERKPEKRPRDFSPVSAMDALSLDQTFSPAA